MKKFFPVLLLAALAGPALTARAMGFFNKADCTFNEKKLYGRIQLVTSFPDVKVQLVSSFPDVKVQRVTSFPDQCGKWLLVNSFPDTRVQLVTSFPDVRIQNVGTLPL